jgi:hypothetical protein
VKRAILWNVFMWSVIAGCAVGVVVLWRFLQGAP